jgi:L-ascorbate metabolism protein UlaG (beta-lactamase superfamily)
MITPDIIATGMGDVLVQPINHATFMLTLGDEAIVFDPCGGLGGLAGLSRPTAIVLTHEHPDHFDPDTIAAIAEQGEVEIIASPGTHALLPEALRQRAVRLANGESGSVIGVPITAIPAYNTSPDKQKFHPRGLVNGYLLDFGGTRFYNASDTEVTQEMRALEDIAVAFVPMNLPYTMTGPEAAEGVKAFRPKIVYPFHYLGGREDKAFAEAMTGVPGIEVRLRDWYEGA